MHLCLHELCINKQPFVDRDVDRTVVCSPRTNLTDRSLNFPKRKLENITVFFLYAVKRRGMTSKESDCQRSSVWSRWALDEYGHTKSAYDTTLMYGWYKFLFGIDTERENLKKKLIDCGTSTACFKACGDKTPLMTRRLITVPGFRD